MRPLAPDNKERTVVLHTALLELTRLLSEIVHDVAQNLAVLLHPKEFMAFVHSLGPLAPWASMVFTVLQTIFAPIPFLAIITLMAVIFGPWKGILFTWLASVFGGVVSFWLARKFHHKIAPRLANTPYFNKLGDFVGTSGAAFCFWLHILPIMPWNVISTLAGLSGMAFEKFFISTALGRLPVISFYTLIIFGLVNLSTRDKTLLLTGLAFLFVGYAVWQSRRKKCLLSAKENKRHDLPRRNNTKH